MYLKATTGLYQLEKTAASTWSAIRHWLTQLAPWALRTLSAHAATPTRIGTTSSFPV